MTFDTFDELFRAATKKDPYPWQRQFAVSDELPYLVRVPTGCGKTAAAVLGWLYRRRFHPQPSVRSATPRRLVYCLPMRVLVEQTFDAVRAWVAGLGLEGPLPVYRLMGGALAKDWVRQPESEAVLVGTMDMLLSRALNRGYAASRFRWPVEFGLLNNDCLWVLDEVQLMGNGLATSAQLAAFRDLLGTARPCPSLWMSATAAREWLATVDHAVPATEITLTAEDLATELGERVRAVKRLERLAVREWPKDGAAGVRELHRPGTLTLVVLNTVERARALFRQLRRSVPDGLEVLLVHSQFRPPERRGLVQRLKCAPPKEGRIVVATQVIEAGVDISAATLVTELAPWGSLVQRFGRCNRFAEYDDARVALVELSPDNQAAPYTPDDLEEARARLERLMGRSVDPATLEGPGQPPRVRHLLRRIDLVDLFDTEPDLAGNDVDVSRFIRDDADVDVQVFWRKWAGSDPPSDLPRPSADELCPVPVWEVREFLRRAGRRTRAGAPVGFVWDHLGRVWRAVDSTELRPGMVLLLPSEAGGYEPETGWDRTATKFVEPLAAGLENVGQEGSVGNDPMHEVNGRWVPLAEHLGRVRDRLQGLLQALELDLKDWERDALLAAALWHDVGKAHRVFQEALLQGLPENERLEKGTALWAKSPTSQGRYERPHFRHELASALALLLAPSELHGLDGQAADLAAYLAAAHHGKVRLVIRSLPGEKQPQEQGQRFARGIWEGDTLGPVILDGATVPHTTLRLPLMEAGRDLDGQPSWTERMLGLRETLGPFRLAYLETLLRVADWTASGAEGLAEDGGDRA